MGYVDLWDSFVGKEDMYVRDGLHLSGKGAAVFAEGLSGAIASGLGKVHTMHVHTYITLDMHIHTYINTYTRTYAHTRTHTKTQTHTHTHTHAYIYTYICMYAQAYTCIHVHACMHAYILHRLGWHMSEYQNCI